MKESPRFHGESVETAAGRKSKRAKPMGRKRILKVLQRQRRRRRRRRRRNRHCSRIGTEKLHHSLQSEDRGKEGGSIVASKYISKSPIGMPVDIGKGERKEDSPGFRTGHIV
jgi:hypothetical protein